MLRTLLLIILLAILAAMGIGAWWLIERIHLQPQREARKEAEEAAQPPPEDPSLPVWRSLLSQLDPQNPAADISAIRDFLAEHPKTPVRQEAFDLLSQRGAHLLFSDIPAPWKIPYTVVSGDSLNRISNRNGVSQEWIMAANNLLDHNLRVGQQLLLPKPSLRLVASRAEGRLFVLNGEEILLALPVIFSKIPEATHGETKVREKAAISGGQRHPFGSPQFVTSEKILSLESLAPSIRSLPQSASALPAALNADPALPPGLFLSQPDMEDLFLITQRGTPVILE